jgi:D-serine deaminase-like pyridoxal phosphate-dependent protein
LTSIFELDTPHLLIDLDATDRNIARARSYCREHGYNFRPHIKAHKMPEIAGLQVAAGAVGICCQKIGEAEVMVEAGIVENVLVTYPIVGEEKIKRLARLAERCRLTVAADSSIALENVFRAAQLANVEIGFLVECDTGGRRLGAQTPSEAAALALEASSEPGIAFRGLMTFPTSPGTRPFFEETCELLGDRAVEAAILSGGGTPTLYRTHELGGVNEVRAGEYVFGDRAHLTNGVIPAEDIAVAVSATVVGRPTADRAIIDCGSKTLSSDIMELADGAPRDLTMGLVKEFPEARIVGLSEEHGHVDLKNCSERPRIGDRVTVMPNHVCSCVNLHDVAALHRSGKVEEIVRIRARGKIR